MAYNNADQLKKLISLLDDERNDIFLHLDADSKINEIDFSPFVKKSKLYKTDNVSVKWAHYSEVEAQNRLLKDALSKGRYKYYHLLSGMDLPIKTQDEIHAFFDDKDKEFIAIKAIETAYNLNHVKYSYPLLNCKKFKKRKALKVLEKVLVAIQKVFGVNRVKKYQRAGWHFYDGWLWFSITDDFARLLIEKEEDVKAIFCKAKAADEMVLQTIAMNCGYKDCFYDINGFRNGSMRYIDWGRGKPYVFREGDFEDLIASPYMFARKFDEKVDGRIVDKIYNYLSEKQNKK